MNRPVRLHRTVLVPILLILVSCSTAVHEAFALPGPVNVQRPAVQAPGPAFTPPVGNESPASGAPAIFSGSGECGPDESVFLAGRGFSGEILLWGGSVKRSGGGPIRNEVLVSEPGRLIVTPRQSEPDGVMLLWAINGEGHSAAVRLNIPHPWWHAPTTPAPGETLRIFGRNLAQRSDMHRGCVYLERPNSAGAWLDVVSASDYELRVALPPDLPTGGYTLWVHAGTGGDYGWGDPLPLEVRRSEPDTRAVLSFGPGTPTEAIRTALARGGRVSLAAGRYRFEGGLVLAAGATLAGAGRDRTFIEISGGTATGADSGIGWDRAISRLVNGGTMEYEFEAPGGAAYTLWIRHRSGDEVPRDHPQPATMLRLSTGGGDTLAVGSLPWSGDWVWTKGGAITLDEGWNRLTASLSCRGEMLLDAFAFTRDTGWNPGGAKEVASARDRVVLQCEDITVLSSWKGRPPGRAYAAVRLAGDGAAIEDCAIHGNPAFSVGVLITDDSSVEWLDGARVRNVRIADIEGRTINNAGIFVERAANVRIEECEITGQNPIFIRGMRDSRIAGNRLVSVSRQGGNGEGYICGRTSPIHRVIIEDNSFGSPYPGAGYTGRRMVWLSTGVGSVDHTFIARNRPERTHFGGVAGTDQNVGEMVLFESCEQTAFYGHPEGAGTASVTLPADGPFWPESVADRKSLPYNAVYDSNAPLEEFYIVVVKGDGLGQMRRVTGRRDRDILLDRPWDVPPDRESMVIMNTMFVQNHIVDNEIAEGMSGVQLWIGCMENIVADNIIRRQRRQGVLVYGCQTTTSSTVPRTWNSGIGPCYYNRIQGNDIEECAAGITLSGNRGLGAMAFASGIAWVPQPGPMDWPLLLGNVIRQNSCATIRGTGITAGGGRGGRSGENTPVAEGTVIEFNLVRDALRSGISLGNSASASTIRRNHVYFWLDREDADLPVGIDIANTAACHEADNNVENGSGGELRTPNRIRTGETEPR